MTKNFAREQIEDFFTLLMKLELVENNLFLLEKRTWYATWNHLVPDKQETERS